MTTNTTRRAAVRALGLAATGAALPGLAGCATTPGAIVAVQSVLVPIANLAQNAPGAPIRWRSVRVRAA